MFVYRCQHCGAETERDAAEARLFGPPRCPETCQPQPDSEGDYAPTMTKIDEREPEPSEVF